MILGSDMDGVIAHNTLNKKDYRPFRLHTYYAQCILGPLCRTNFDTIITGRRIHYKKVTVDWLRENNVEYNTLVMFPNKMRKDNRSLSQFKSSVINELGVTKYYEDDERIAKYLKEKCEETEIVIIETNPINFNISSTFRILNGEKK